MDEIHLEILRNQQLMSWAMVALTCLSVFGLVVFAMSLQLALRTRGDTRDLGEMVREVMRISREVAQISERVEQRSERLGYYLFSKFGPADTK